MDRGMIKIANKMAISLSKYFKNQEKLFLQSFNNQEKYYTKQDDINWKEQDEILFELMKPFYREGALYGYEIATDTYNFLVSFDADVNPRVINAVNEWGLSKAKGINETTLEQLNNEIQNGINLGESNQLIARRINKVYKHASEKRSTTIARTEVHNAVNVGTFETYNAAGVEKKEWLAVLDERVRTWHADIDGQTQNIDDPFITGNGNALMFPGDPSSGVADEVINCRCAVAAVFEV